ncbi:hypothetical protein LOTGIDRAFT_169597 [Lottia gigantea]|uniref:Uncharacterized protein n=1 Tax=Lottia gigantea TaxID=225164 RepID=V3YYG7_LOTGI|nr:hypothetical protein LOTGIDRAFT_169597 [Lottia gigantea]ESO83188.1 hypothetical protein LOTGIDRAFT_169597 [Lottia gigantea]
MTSYAMPRSYSQVPEELSSQDQSRDYYEPLNAILHRLRELILMQPHSLRETIRYTQITPTTPIPIAMKKRSRLSINQELKSLANLLVLRENKRREAQKTKLRSKLLSIGKRSMPQNQDRDHVIEETPVSDRDMFLTELFAEISEQEMTYVLGQVLGSEIAAKGGNEYQGQERLPYEI